MTATAGTQAVDRAAGLLVQILQTDGQVTFAQLQHRSGLAKSTLSRLLSSLQRHGLVTRTDDGGFDAGPVLVHQGASPIARLLSAAAPHLRELSTATGETINLAVLDGNEVNQIDQVDCRYLMGFVGFAGNVNWVGQRVPLHCSAVGKIFLASGAALPAGRLQRRTTRTLANRADLAADLDRVRERGWALADSELEEGLVAVAAPVRGSDGRVLAALSITGPTTRLTPDRYEDLGRLTKTQADRLSVELGCTSVQSESTTRRAGAA
ncbi:MAG: IclR family transcriptional regulator [Actinomycetales bacterium]